MPSAEPTVEPASALTALVASDSVLTWLLSTMYRLAPTASTANPFKSAKSAFVPTPSAFPDEPPSKPPPATVVTANEGRAMARMTPESAM